MDGEPAVSAVHTAYEGEEVGADRVLRKVIVPVLQFSAILLIQFSVSPQVESVRLRRDVRVY
jgi:hypothetical protein